MSITKGCSRRRALAQDMGTQAQGSRGVSRKEEARDGEAQGSRSKHGCDYTLYVSNFYMTISYILRLDHVTICYSIVSEGRT